MCAGVPGMEDTLWSGPEPVADMPRRSSFPALAMSSLWNALPSSGQRPAQRTQSLSQPLALSREAPALYVSRLLLESRLGCLQCYAVCIELQSTMKALPHGSTGLRAILCSPAW